MVSTGFVDSVVDGPVKIRSATTEDSAALGLITVSASLSAFVGRIPEESLDFGWRPEDSAAGWRATLLDPNQGQVFLVAEVGRIVVGFVWAGVTTADADGEIRGLYVLPTRHGQGIGRLLVAHAVNRLEQQEAIESLVVGCIRENPSCGFYRRLGGVEVYRRPNAVDRFQTEEVFFSWSDLSGLRIDDATTD